jgi:hypothetical protein
MDLLFKAEVVKWNSSVRFEQFQIVKETPKQYKIKRIDTVRWGIDTIHKDEVGVNYFTHAEDALNRAIELAKEENRKANEQIKRVSAGIAKIEAVLKTNIPAGHWWDGETWTTSKPEEWIVPKADEFTI